MWTIYVILCYISDNNILVSLARNAILIFKYFVRGIFQLDHACTLTGKNFLYLSGYIGSVYIRYKDCSNWPTSFSWLICRSFMYNTNPVIMGQTIKLILNTIKTNILMVYNYIAMFMEYKTWWRPQDIETLGRRAQVFINMRDILVTNLILIIAYHVQVIPLIEI